MTSETKVYHVTQAILQMANLAFIGEKLSWPQFYEDLARKANLFLGGLMVQFQ